VSVSEIRGRVTWNGRGVANVVVSDGLHVTRTDEAGDWALPGNGPFVFLTRPTGFTAEPWFVPSSTPRIDFALQPEEQPVPFTFAHVTDLHLSLGDPTYGEGQGDATFWVDDEGLHDRIVTTPSVLERLFAELAAQRPDFVVATGDLTNNGTPEELRTYASLAASSAVPVVSVPGNHDHHSPTEGAAPPYERELGPRWFSFDHAGVHFAAIDWWTWRLRQDHETQETWLAADLAAVPDEVPVILLTHDQMDSAFFDRLPRRPIATFSGHWHTTRVVRDKGTVHYNTGTATFGGLDYSPAHYRLATWDGERLSVRTVARGPNELAGATLRSGTAAAGPHRWAAALSGGAHLAGPVVVGDRVLAVSRNEDEPGGALHCFAVVDGAPEWVLPLEAAVKTAPVVVGDAVVASSVAGETVCVGLLDGALRWRVQVDDPLRPWVHLRPATDGRLVFVGDVGRFAALDATTGATVWERDDLGRRENLTSFSHPVIAGGRLLVAFAGQSPSLWALDPATGASVWPVYEAGRSIYSDPSLDVAANLPLVVMGGMTADPGGDDVYLVRLGARLDRISALDGTTVWSAPFSGWFNPAPPVVHDGGVLATEGFGRLFSFGYDGEQRWATSVGRNAPLAMGSYRADGPVCLAPPTVVGDAALLPTGDGRVVTVRLADGEIRSSLDVGVPVTAALALAGDQALALGVDGVLRSLPLDLVLA